MQIDINDIDSEKPKIDSVYIDTDFNVTREGLWYTVETPEDSFAMTIDQFNLIEEAIRFLEKQ